MVAIDIAAVSAGFGHGDLERDTTGSMVFDTTGSRG
jgi:hypothetical protein